MWYNILKGLKYWLEDIKVSVIEVWYHSKAVWELNNRIDKEKVLISALCNLGKDITEPAIIFNNEKCIYLKLNRLTMDGFTN